MTTKLYDIYTARAGKREDTTFSMRAPMNVIQSVFELQYSAVIRINEEFKNGKCFSEIHHNGRGRWSFTMQIIKPATVALGTELSQ